MAANQLPIQYAFGTDPESTAANERYQQAYDKLLKTIETRQEKPMFDPFWLKIAEAGAKPTSTGSFFESLGNTAGAINKFQEEEKAKAENLAKMNLELAGMGLQQANQRASLNEYKAASQAAPQAPSGLQGTPGSQASPSSSILSSMGYEDQGQQIGPAVPLPTERQFVAGKVATGGNPIEARMEYQKLLRDDLKVGPNGTVYQMSTGRLFAPEDPTPIEVPLISLGGEKFSVTKDQARQLNAFTKSGDTQGRIAFENRLRGVPQPQQPSAQPSAAPLAAPPVQPSVAAPVQPSPQPPMGAQTAPVTAPTVRQTTSPVASSPVVPSAQPPTPSAPPAAPPVLASSTVAPGAGMQPQSVRDRLAAEEKKRRDIDQAIAIKKGEAQVAEEAKNKEENRKDDRELVVETKRAGRNQVNIADQYAKLVTEYPNAIGTAAKPGFLSAGIKLLESGASLGGESAKASALQEAVATLRGTPEELSARRVMMGLAAEYLFNLRALAKGQGAITDYETQILSRIGPGIEDDAKTARFKASIMKMHGEAEIARANEYNEWKKSNQGMGWKDYLGSKEHDKFAAKYDQDLAKAYDIYLGKKPQARAQPQSSSDAMNFARSLK